MNQGRKLPKKGWVGLNRMHKDDSTLKYQKWINILKITSIDSVLYLNNEKCDAKTMMANKLE